MNAPAKFIDPLVPDLANPPRVRKRRAPKHDFKDGQGRVFAHKHDNGGGWVADTAWVAPTATVTRNAQVFGFARVHDYCKISGRSKVFGRARLFDSVHVEQDAAVFENAVIHDTARIQNNAIVRGFARLVGNNTLRNRIEICDNAVVINSNLGGPRAHVYSHVHGSARLLNCYAWGWIDIYDLVFAENVQFCNVIASGTARLLNSQITTHLTYYYSAFLDDRIAALPSELSSLRDAVSIINGTIINSQIATTRMIVRPNTKYVQTTLNCAMPDNDPFLRDVFANVDDHTFVGWNARDQNGVRNMVETTLNPTAAQAPQLPGPARGEANFDAVRQRRIMRMEGA